MNEEWVRNKSGSEAAKRKPVKNYAEEIEKKSFFKNEFLKSKVNYISYKGHQHILALVIRLKHYHL